ncbi:MAG: barstar family protein [Burkholderiales bacterium]|nr:barstar family protein [Burkholderiales bacterium]
MTDLAQQLVGPRAGGVYQLLAEPRDVERAAKRAGLAVFRVDIHHVHGKADFLQALAKALAFPEWFGGNWDALADVLTDLSWHEAPGYVLVLEKAKHFGAGHREDFATAMDVLGFVVNEWHEEGKPFWVFVAGAQGWDAGLPKWPPASPE